MLRRKKNQKITILGNKSKSSSDSFRKKYYKKGYELINITELCEANIKCSGWCNDINHPSEKLFHVQITYRNEEIVNLTGNKIYAIDDDRIVVWTDSDDPLGNDFIIFMKRKLK